MNRQGTVAEAGSGACTTHGIDDLACLTSMSSSPDFTATHTPYAPLHAELLASSTLPLLQALFSCAPGPGSNPAATPQQQGSMGTPGDAASFARAGRHTSDMVVTPQPPPRWASAGRTALNGAASEQTVTPPSVLSAGSHIHHAASEAAIGGGGTGAATTPLAWSRRGSEPGLYGRGGSVPPGRLLSGRGGSVTPGGPPAPPLHQRSGTVAGQFRSQLGDLMAQLGAMQPHYVRCVKPNARSEAATFDAAYALQQLKWGGVMEAVRISCAGGSCRG